MQLRGVLIEVEIDSPESFEARWLSAEFARRGLAIHRATLDEVRERARCLGCETLVAGSVPFVSGALAALGVRVPKPNDYPKSLRPFLGRRIWPSRLSRIRSAIKRRKCPALFVKPRGTAKLFTGRVIRKIEDLEWLASFAPGTPVWCSSPVRWISEWRVFINEGRSVAFENYDGDPRRRPNLLVVDEMLRARRFDACPAGYAIDVGILASGETTIVEVNDAVGLGANGAEGDVFADVLWARWRQLCDSEREFP